MTEDDPVSANPEHDFCSHEGAILLKAKIEAFWRERGKLVCLKLRQVGFHPAIRESRWVVDSDMVNGWPREAPVALDYAEAA